MFGVEKIYLEEKNCTCFFVYEYLIYYIFIFSILYHIKIIKLVIIVIICVFQYGINQNNNNIILPLIFNCTKINFNMYKLKKILSLNIFEYFSHTNITQYKVIFSRPGNL